MIEQCYTVKILIIAISGFAIFFICLSAWAFYMGCKAQQKQQANERSDDEYTDLVNKLKSMGLL